MKLDEMILRELDKQQIRANVISIIMNELKNIEKKNEFLDFIIQNRTVLLNETELFINLRKITNN